MAKVSKYLNQTQVIEGVEYKTVSYFKGKVEVAAEGYEGSTWMVTKTWVNAKIKTFKKRLDAFFKKIIGKVTSVALMIIKQPSKKECEEQKEDRCTLIGFKAIYDLKELKKAYRRLSKIFHPDMGGNAQAFKEMHINYKKRKYAIKSTTELFEECPEFSEFTTFEEEVDDAMINTNWDGVFEKGEF